MSEKQIIVKVVDRIVARFRVDEEDVKMNSEFGSDFNADSLDMMELAMDLEDEFSITIPDNAVFGVHHTVEDVINDIKSRVLDK